MQLLQLVVTFLTFCTADMLHCYAIHFMIFQIFMEFFVDAIEFISGAIAVEVNLCFPVAIDTPAHAQLGKLVHFRHFLDITMTCLALLFAYFYVLAMIEINMVGQVVNFNPLNWFGAIGYAITIIIGVIFGSGWVPACVFV